MAVGGLGDALWRVGAAATGRWGLRERHGCGRRSRRQQRGQADAATSLGEAHRVDGQ